MRYKQTVVTTALPVTLAEAKMQCAVADATDYDEHLADLIERATLAVGEHVGRQIMSATWTLTLDGFPDEIQIAKAPVTAISSITYTDCAGDSQTLSSDYYQTDLATNDGPARIKPAHGYVWPDTQPDTYGTVVVTFTCGYASRSAVPATLKHAVLFLVSHWFRSREPITQERVASEVPSGLQMLLALGDTGVDL